MQFSFLLVLSFLSTAAMAEKNLRRLLLVVTETTHSDEGEDSDTTASNNAEELPSDVATSTTNNVARDGTCGDGMVNPQRGEQCDYGIEFEGITDTQTNLVNGGDFSPCNVDCTWKKNTQGHDCDRESVFFDMYLVTDSKTENWAELKVDGVSVWNPQLHQYFTAVDDTPYAKPNVAYKYSTCMDRTKCWTFEFLDETTKNDNMVDVFESDNNWAKLVVLLDGRLEFTDQDYLDGESASVGFDWGICPSRSETQEETENGGPSSWFFSPQNFLLEEMYK